MHAALVPHIGMLREDVASISYGQDNCFFCSIILFGFLRNGGLLGSGPKHGFSYQMLWAAGISISYGMSDLTFCFFDFFSYGYSAGRMIEIRHAASVPHIEIPWETGISTPYGQDYCFLLVIILFFRFFYFFGLQLKDSWKDATLYIWGGISFQRVSRSMYCCAAVCSEERRVLKPI